METIKFAFAFIDSLTKEDIKTIDDVLRNERLIKYLWIEFILNPHLVKISQAYTENSLVKESFIDALSWYLAFKWLFPKNEGLEELYKEKIIVPYRVKGNIYRQNKRTFLKGLLHARLC